MFKIGEVLVLTVIENGDGEHEYFNCKVEKYEDGLLKIRDPMGKTAVYNVHSRNFVKARKQDD